MNERPMRTRFKPLALVAVQGGAILFLLATGPLLPQSPWLIALLVLGLGLGLWAMLAMGLRRVRVSPEPAPDVTLSTAGPYRWIRHPMYTAVLSVTIALLFSHATIGRTVAWTVLLVDLLIKLRYEEKRLVERIADYAEYMKKTKRLIPFVY
jgi:protein-S-isoprenylcysteine O-methyltransferase Ste14